MALDAFLAELLGEFPFVRVVPKQGWFWTVLDWLVRVLSLGRNQTFLTNYWTTIGPVIGHPAGQVLGDWAVPILRHERIHLRQTERTGFVVLAVLTLGLALLGRRTGWMRAVAFFVGIVPCSLAYLLLPLPAGLAFCRYLMEREAYAESIRCALESGGLEAAIAAVDRAVELLTGNSYVWTWPFPSSVRAWFDDQLTRAIGR